MKIIVTDKKKRGKKSSSQIIFDGENDFILTKGFSLLNMINNETEASIACMNFKGIIIRDSTSFKDKVKYCWSFITWIFNISILGGKINESNN